MLQITLTVVDNKYIIETLIKTFYTNESSHRQAVGRALLPDDCFTKCARKKITSKRFFVLV